MLGEQERELLGKIQNYISENDNFTNTRDNETELKASVLEMVYPVGSIYIGTTNVNPSTFIGGEWQRYAQGKVLVGVNEEDEDFSEAEITGGEKQHQLTVEEIPSHNHVLGVSGSNAGNSIYPIVGGSSKYGSQAHAIGYAGGNQAHNNLQPYIVTYMWKRIR